ncbi:MAG: Ig-like domain-containing protein, partial [Patescibacteria group bacterium]
SINFGKDKNLGQTALDDRDGQGVLKEHKIHYITVKNLDSSSDYYFSITSGSKEFLQKAEPFIVKTAPASSGPSAIEKTVKGKIVLPNGDNPKEATVYLNSDNSQTLSTLVKEGGSYSLSVSSLKTQDLSSYFTISGETVFRLLIAGEDSLTSNARFNNSESEELPPITLGSDYDFTQSNLSTASPSASTGFSSLTAQESTTGKIPKINIPKNNQTFTDSQPKFSGTALPNSTVEITIRSLENIKAQVVTDAYGNWTFRPTTPLSPGEHTITMVARDVSGILRTITQSFTVFASGTQVSESATPSATPVVTPTSVPISTPIPTSVPTIIPTIPVSPTLAPIATITPVISPIPAPGNSTPIILGLFGIGLSILGFFIFLLSRGITTL